MTDDRVDPLSSGIETSEGAQEMTARGSAGAEELLRELGATLRLSEAEVAELVSEGPSEDQTMIINMGPQHPSTHGVLRLMLELEGETVLRTKPIVGYLHTGMEKTGEDLTYLQGPTNVTRMDYAAPLFNELVFSLTTEKLLGIDEDIPERAQWIRMLLTELNRITSNLLFLATNGMDIGAVSMMIYGWRDREEGLRLLEMITGLRMNHNYIRPGGVAADLPDGWRDAVLTFIDSIPAEPRRVRRAPHRPADLPGAAPGRRRDHRAGGHRPRRHRSDPALHRGAVGPPPRHALPPLRRRSSSTSWSAPTATASTATPSASTRSASRSGSSARCSTPCRRATTASRTRRSRRRRALASTSRWRR